MSTPTSTRRTVRSARQARYHQFIEALERRNLLAFTIAVIPDTQHMVWTQNGQAAIETAWIQSQKTIQNIQYVVHVGDVVNDGGSDATEWVEAREALDNIAAMNVPFGIAQGNHDHENWASHPAIISGTATFNANFGPASTYFSGKPWYGSMPTTAPYYNSGGTNTWQKFTADGQTFLSIVLEDEPSDLAFTWAESVMAANLGLPVMITTHQVINQSNSYLALDYHSGTAPAAPDTPSGANAGIEIGNWVASHDDRIFLVLCGHASSAMDAAGWSQGNGLKTLTGVNGNPVWIQMTDYQENRAGPNGATQFDGGAMWVRMMTFDLAARTIKARTYSPGWNSYSSDLPGTYGVVQPFNEPVNESDFTINFATATQIPGATLPNITIAASGSPSEAGPTTGTYTLTRSGSITSALTVNVAMSGTATNGTDYNTIGTTVGFAAGSATKTVTLTPIADALTESSETAIMTVTAGTGYTTGGTPSATLNIANSGGTSAAAYEGLNYTPGTGANIAGQNTGTGFGANWTVSNTALVNILAGSLNYTAAGKTLQNGANSINVTNFGSANGTLAAPIGTLGTTTWIGFELKSDRISGTGTLNGEVRINGSTLRLGSPLGGNLSAIATGNIYLPSTVAAVTGATNFVVYRIQYLSTGSVIDMFANPTPGVTPTTPTSSLTLPSTTVLTVSSSIIFKSNNDATATNTIDELRIGNSYLAVAPEATNPVPNAPSGAAVAPSGTSLNVTWTDNATNETGMRVWRSTDNVNFSIVQNLGANATSWLDTTVTGGVVYYYKVTAFNAAGESAFSNTASATAPIPLPASPTNLVTGVPGTSSLSMIWTDNANNETGFKVYRSTDNATWGSPYTTIATPNTTSYTDNAPAAGVGYFYKVVAYNAAGESTSAAGMTCEVATVQAHDRFNYTPGDGSNIAGQNNGVGLSANWTTSNNTLVSIVAGSLNYSAAGHALTTSGNSIKVTNFGSANGTLATPIGTLGTTTWIGFELKSDRISGTGTLNGEVRINGSTLRLGSPLGGNLSAIATGNIYLRSTVAAVTGATNFVVYRIQYLSTGSVIDMFANPTPGVTPTTPTSSLMLPSTTVLTVSSSIIVKSNNDATATNTMDEIRVGSSYIAVAPDPLVPQTSAARPGRGKGSASGSGESSRGVNISHIPTRAVVSIRQSVFEEHPSFQAIAGARRTDASTNPDGDADWLNEDP
jgi:hypothetical protein